MNSNDVGDEIGATTGSPERLARSLDADLCPVGLPVITARMLNDVAALRTMRDAGAVHHVNMGGRETGWLLTGSDAAARALVDPALLGEPAQAWPRDGREAGGEELPDEEDLFFLPEEQHARLRRLLTRQVRRRKLGLVAQPTGLVLMKIAAAGLGALAGGSADSASH